MAVPARQADLTDLPPAWIGVGTLDLSFDEDLAYSQRLPDAGAPGKDEVVEGAFHAFDMLVPNAGPSLRFFASQCDFLRTTFVR